MILNSVMMDKLVFRNMLRMLAVITACHVLVTSVHMEPGWSEWMPLASCLRPCTDPYGTQTLVRACQMCRRRIYGDLGPEGRCVEVKDNRCHTENDEYLNHLHRVIECLNKECHDDNDVTISDGVLTSNGPPNQSANRIKRGWSIWGTWTGWSCDQPCINGRWLTRTRQCNRERGQDCRGSRKHSTREIIPCRDEKTNQYICSKYWSGWSSWTPCVQPPVCNQEIFRQRACKGFGRQCDGDATETRRCPCSRSPQQLRDITMDTSVTRIKRSDPEELSVSNEDEGSDRKTVMMYAGGAAGGFIFLLLTTAACYIYCINRKKEGDEQKEEENNLTNNCKESNSTWNNNVVPRRGMSGVKLWMNEACPSYKDWDKFSQTKYSQTKYLKTKYSQASIGDEQLSKRSRRRKDRSKRSTTSLSEEGKITKSYHGYRNRKVSSRKQIYHGATQRHSYRLSRYTSAPEQCHIIGGVMQRCAMDRDCQLSHHSVIRANNQIMDDNQRYQSHTQHHSSSPSTRYN